MKNMNIDQRLEGRIQEKLGLNAETRIELWMRLAKVIERYVAELPRTRVAPEVDMEKIRSLLAPLDFTRPLFPYTTLFRSRAVQSCPDHYGNCGRYPGRHIQSSTGRLESQP